MANDDKFWESAREEIEAGENVTVSRDGHVITCTSLAELWQARAGFETESASKATAKASDFPKGCRVRFHSGTRQFRSNFWKGRLGTVMSQGKGKLVCVQWDGNKSTEVYCPEWLELAGKP